MDPSLCDRNIVDHSEPVRFALKRFTWQSAAAVRELACTKRGSCLTLLA
jgi:hypothetical protein